MRSKGEGRGAVPRLEEKREEDIRVRTVASRKEEGRDKVKPKINV